MNTRVKLHIFCPPSKLFDIFATKKNTQHIGEAGREIQTKFERTMWDEGGGWPLAIDQSEVSPRAVSQL